MEKKSDLNLNAFYLFILNWLLIIQVKISKIRLQRMNIIENEKFQNSASTEGFLQNSFQDQHIFKHNLMPLNKSLNVCY
jgi:hypothetical protein